MDWVTHIFGLFGSPGRVCTALVEDLVLTSQVFRLICIHGYSSISPHPCCFQL